MEGIEWGEYGYDFREVVYRKDFSDPEELQINTTLLNAKAPAYSSEAEIRFCVNKSLMCLPQGELSRDNPPVRIDPNTFPPVLSSI